MLEQNNGRGSNFGKVCPRYTLQGALLKFGCALRSPGDVGKMHILIQGSAVRPGIGDASELSGDAVLQVRGPHRSKGPEGPNLCVGGDSWREAEDGETGRKAGGREAARRESEQGDEDARRKGRRRAGWRMRRARREAAGTVGCAAARAAGGGGRGRGRVLTAAAAAAAQSRPGARGGPAAARAAWLRDLCAAMARPPRQRPGAWVPLLLLLLTGPGTCAASPADDGAGPGGRGPRGRVRGDAGADEAVPRHDSSYGTFAGEFYDLRYLSEEGEAARGRRVVGVGGDRGGRGSRAGGAVW